MKVELKEIKNIQLFKAYQMHFKGFLPTFINYRDKINPIFCTYAKFKKYFNNKNMYMYFITLGELYVGQIWILQKEEVCKLVRIFVLSKFQNKGIATQAILQAEQIFNHQNHWWLDTIKQEQNNCHLYEKLGYKPNGKEKVINKHMTIIEYEKRT